MFSGFPVPLASGFPWASSRLSDSEASFYFEATSVPGGSGMDVSSKNIRKSLRDVLDRK